MELWYTDQHTKDVRFSMKIEEQIASCESEFQRIDILKSCEFGKVLVLDGELMITQKDEFIYHEMISHVPMAVHPNVKNVLVIGAGDGGTIRELTKYDTIERIDMVEIDKMVTDMCLEHFQETSCKLNDKRVHMYFEESLRYVRMKNDEYDLIIVDCADPYGPAEGLFTREFYGNCFKALHDDGILINQHESPYYSEHSRTVQKAHNHIKLVFPFSTVYQCHIPSYPSGHWLFGFASKKYDPINDLNEEAWNKLGIKTRYYNTDLHKGSFYLPTYVKELLGTNE
ncbi:polyamine aminopropyltransferase [[Clostridium] fimetarium]|uniref:Polyamine aminopropyltransferase n=1 Tax=[Clostridium] fimetarium TaxID=99656 RepID=A0A1I0RE89_9FIRM|nr:polyamine aminopropyltransferase [[Clostridium] fimetarium]SEW38558.1 spermidine synthase [[Clostridium] fimetarium]